MEAHPDNMPELTPDQFRRWEKSLRRDTRLLMERAGTIPRVAQSTTTAESLLDRACELRADTRFHAAEICLVDALLCLNEALAVA
jgi:hypothetical protein